MDYHRRHVRNQGTFSLPTADGGRTPVDRICEALSNETCRYVLYTLDEDEAIRLEELVNAVAEKVVEQSPRASADAVRQKVRVDLHHHHLPKLCHLGIIEYDPRSETIRYRDPPPHLDEFLQLTRKLDTE